MSVNCLSDGILTVWRREVTTKRFSALDEDVQGAKLGEVWQFPLKFVSGIMQGQFIPQGWLLYVGGLPGLADGGSS